MAAAVDTLDTADRIVERLPRFYKAWDKQSIFFRFLKIFAQSFDEQRKDLYSIMRSHWVDTAHGSDLDFLGSIYRLKRRPNELDDSFRKRIKFFIVEFTGGGTKESILAQTALYLDLQNEKPEMIENPATPQTLEKRVKSEDKWIMRSLSIHDENFAVTILIDQVQGDILEVFEPTITDLDRNISIKYNGNIRSGQKLLIKQDLTAELDGEDVTNKISTSSPYDNPPSTIKILRKGSRWTFKESISPKMGKFDEANFDDHVFEMFVPTVLLRFEWIALLLAAFELKVSDRALIQSGVLKADLEEIVNAIKASGVKAFVTIVNENQ